MVKNENVLHPLFPMTCVWQEDGGSGGLLGEAFVTYAFAVNLHLVYDAALFSHTMPCGCRHPDVVDVSHASAFTADEMGMWHDNVVVADVVVVDGYHLCRPFLREHAQGVVDCRL